MKKIYLFGKKKSVGSFDDFFNTKKYKTYQQAKKNNDYVIVDFMIDKTDTIFVRLCHSQCKLAVKWYRLEYQNCPCGLDVLDDNNICQLAREMYK